MKTKTSRVAVFIRQLALICSITLPSIILIFQTVAELCSGNQFLTHDKPPTRPPTFIILITRLFRWKAWLTNQLQKSKIGTHRNINKFSVFRNTKSNKRAVMVLSCSPEYHWNQIISKSVQWFSRGSRLKLFSIYSPGGNLFNRAKRFEQFL